MTSRVKNFLFYLTTLLLSCLIALAILEVVLRNISYSTGTGIGRASQRWMKENWKPVNELGIRDFRITIARLNFPQPKVYFLGDSFTAGHGVEFKHTYYYQTGEQVSKDFNLFNLSVNGASTRSELQILYQFNTQTGVNAEAVVHQYFFNDIEDYITRPDWSAPPMLQTVARYLASAEFLLSYRFNKEWGEEYKSSLMQAYTDPKVLEKHLNDLRILHQYIRQQRGRVVFVVFPALYPDETLQQSQQGINIIRDFFATTCQSGDIYLDATGVAESLPESKRVVNFMDPHPSRALHTLVAQEVQSAIRQQTGRPHLIRCTDMRTG